MKKLVCIFVFVLSVMLCACAAAATLTLPSSLTTIEEEAFCGATHLDQVVVGNKTKVIGSRAFAGSSVKNVTLPSSLYYIADDAFEGVSGLTVSAAEGSYAYTWAVKNGYIKISDVPADGITKIVMPSILQAGANLEIQVFGPENTVSHTVFLINNDTKKGKTNVIRKRNGVSVWYGNDLDNGSYTVRIYTITEKSSIVTPIEKTLVVTGKRPSSPDVPVPEKLGWEEYWEDYEPYEELFVKFIEYDKDGNEINRGETTLWEDSRIHLWRSAEEAVRMDVSFTVYRDGLWSEWSEAKSIELVDYSQNRPQIEDLIMPETITAGRDLEITFKCASNIDDYDCWIGDKNRNCLYNARPVRVNENIKIIFPGYVLDPGKHTINIEFYSDQHWYTVMNKEITIIGEKINANIHLNADKDSVYTEEQVELVITSNGTEEAFIRIEGDRVRFIGCNLINDGSGICSTQLDVLYSGTKSREVKLSACVFLGDSWSEWSDPITVTVSRPEPLPTPLISVNDNFGAGEDIVVSVSNIDEADYYDVNLEEYFSGKSVLSRYFYKNNYGSNFGEDVVFSGAQFGSGSYRVVVLAYSDIRGSSSTSKLVKVSGTRAAAPAVTYTPDEFRINQTTAFTIDTTDCEKISVTYNGSGNSDNWFDSHIINPTGNETVWNYRFPDYSEGSNFTFAFSVKKNGKWTYSRNIKGTVRGWAQLDAPVIVAQDSYIAGHKIQLSFLPVDNATNYRERVEMKQGDRWTWVQETNTSSQVPMELDGYSTEPGNYRFTVEASAEGYKSNISTYEFTVTEYEYTADLITVSADKTELYTNEPRPTITVTAPGAEAIRTNDWNVYSADENGMVQYSPYMYLGNSEEKEYKFSFCAVYDDVWSEWTEPITIKLKKAPGFEPLEKAVIHLPENIVAGQDLAFSFDAVDGAASYNVYIRRYYGDESIYSNYEAKPSTEMTVTGCNLIAGTYIARVIASATGRDSSTNDVVFKITGQRADAPNVTTDKEAYAAGEAITFSIDTTGAEEFSYKYSFSGSYSGGSGDNIQSTTGSISEWKYTIPPYFTGVTYTFTFNVKKDSQWTKAKTITIVIP